MQYLITGATGFIGSHLVREILKDLSATVIALVRKGSNLWRLQGLDTRLVLIEIDFSNDALFFNSVKKYKPRVMFHVAWEGVHNAHRNAPLQIRNLSLLEDLLRLARDVGVETFVGVGSQAEYGIKNHPVKEDEELNPLTLYGVEKKKAFQMVKRYCSDQGIKYIWLRLFASYGPMDHPTWLIPYVIFELLQDKAPLLTEGFQLWDYLYVEDVAKAIALSSYIDESGVYNLGSGAPVTIRRIVQEIYDQIKPGKEPPFGTLSQRGDQPKDLIADITKLVSKTSWRPSVSLEEGIYKTIESLINKSMEDSKKLFNIIAMETNDRLIE